MRVLPSSLLFGCVPVAGYSVLKLCYILFNIDHLIIAVVLSTKQ